MAQILIPISNAQPSCFHHLVCHKALNLKNKNKAAVVVVKAMVHDRNTNAGRQISSKLPRIACMAVKCCDKGPRLASVMAYVWPDSSLLTIKQMPMAANKLPGTIRNNEGVSTAPVTYTPMKTHMMGSIRDPIVSLSGVVSLKVLPKCVETSRLHTLSQRKCHQNQFHSLNETPPSR